MSKVGDPQHSIPDGWKWKRLSEIILTPISGGRPKGGASSESGTIPSIGGEHITKGGLLDFSSAKYIPKNYFEKIKFSKLEPGDILICKDGALAGKVAFYGKNYFHQAAVNEHVFILRPKNEDSAKYLFFSLQSEDGQNQIKRILTGSAQPGLTKTFPDYYILKMPSHFEQHKIAAILSSVDAAIEQTDDIIAQTERMKKGLVQELFIKGINHKEFKKSPIGRIPNEWEVVKIEYLINRKIISEVQDGNHGELHPKEGDFQDEGIPFITANCLNHGRISFDNAKFLDSIWLKKLRIGFAKPNDILLTHKGTIGQTNILGDEYDTVILSPQVTYYRISDTSFLLPEYLHVVFQSHNFQNKIKQLSMQSTRAYLSITQQKNILIPLPSPIEQQKISSIILAVDGKLENEREHETYLLKLKNGLMQDLLTGRVRVKVDAHA